jgi:hypothetical protein
VQPFSVGVTVMVEVMAILNVSVTTNEPMPPVPLPARPIEVLLFVHVYVAPGGVLVKLTAGSVPPAQIVVLVTVFTDGLGLTLIVIVEGVPAQPATVGVTVMVDVIVEVPVLVPVKPGKLPVPLPGKPVLVLLFVQVKVPPGGTVAKLVGATVAPGQMVLGAGMVVGSTVGFPLTVIV